MFLLSRIMTNEKFIDYHCDNVIKYCNKWLHKGDIKYLQKARRCLDWMIETIGNKTAENSF